MISFDYILDKIGVIGVSQLLICFLLSYDNAVGGYHSLLTVFIAYEPDYRCQVPPIDNATVYPNLNESDILNYTTPYNGAYDYCLKYGYDYTECDGTLSCVNKTADQIQCDQGYWYDRSLFTETVITEFDLVCDRSYLIPLSTSMYYVGMFVGSLLFGNVADRFGRKPTLIVSTILTIACSFGCTFSISVEMYSVFRALVACFHYGATIGTFVYIMEVVGPKWRTAFGMIYQVFFSLGFMILGGLAYNWRNWHNLLLVVSILSTPVLVIALIIPESPRWLFAMERDEEGIKVTELMARLNGAKLTEKDWDEARKAGEEKLNQQTQTDSSTKHSILDLFRKPGIRLTTFNVMFNWFVNSFVYYGISLNAGSLAGDIFINNTLNGVFEIASYVFCMLVMDRIGRRILLSGMLLLSGIGLIASVIVNEYAGENESLITLGVVFAFVAKFGISGSFAIIYNFTTELYPTVIRSTGLGNGSMASRIGGITAPYVISLQNTISWLPNVIFGVFGLAAGLISLTFPETTGQPMMETLEQAEVFYKTGKVLDLNQVDVDKINSNNLQVDSAGCDNFNFDKEETITSVQF